jgi:UDP-N-acetylglucosamine:LPS N-acetylglucosamine transferase
MACSNQSKEVSETVVQTISSAASYAHYNTNLNDLYTVSDLVVSGTIAQPGVSG